MPLARMKAELDRLLEFWCGDFFAADDFDGASFHLRCRGGGNWVVPDGPAFMAALRRLHEPKGFADGRSTEDANRFFAVMSRATLILPR